MKNKINYVWLLALLWLVWRCKNGEQLSTDVTQALQTSPQTVEPISKDTSLKKDEPTDIYTQAALETCQCMQPMADKATLLKELEENNQTTDMKIVANEMAQLEPQIQKCSDEIHRKYGKIQSHSEVHVLNALDEQCPNVKILFSYLEKVSKTK
jgi:hypothetical protein